MTNIQRVTFADERLTALLAELLVDSVDGGASVGFLAPLAAATAQSYWRQVLGSLGPALALWIAENNGRVVGSVQLALCEKENGRHRGEVQKLFVHSANRGQGIAARLMAELEAFARGAGRTLLCLDTQSRSTAETVYQHLGWQRAGEIPDYALTPHGQLHPTALYYKRLPRAPEIL
jgi:GNAT superfamily N-acetyltransferase